MKLYLILGCWGRKENDFISCSSVLNKILDLTAQTETNRKIIDFLDNNYRLCDKPLYSNIHTALFSIQNEFSQLNNPIFDKSKFYKIEEFIQLHKKCGLYLRFSLEG